MTTPINVQFLLRNGNPCLLSLRNFLACLHMDLNNGFGLCRKENTTKTIFRISRILFPILCRNEKIRLFCISKSELHFVQNELHIQNKGAKKSFSYGFIIFTNVLLCLLDSCVWL